MASPYALPSSALPHAHQHHFHSHSHSQSQSSISSWKTAGSNGGLHPHPEDEGYYDDAPEQPYHYSHDRTASQLSNSGSALSRPKAPPAPLDRMSGWTEERTLGGRGPVTPGFDTPTLSSYSPSKLNEPHRHDHDHLQEHIHYEAHAHGHHGHDSHDHHHGHNHDHLHNHDHDHGHGHVHHHDHDVSAQPSFFTRLLLPYTAKMPILHTIMTEKDSRRIFYFMALNFSFMAVQAFYGYVTESLGLLSDSIHMFFDCVALLVGLLAAVMSKWPPSQRFPYGFVKIEALSGFANGILLMLLSLEIAFEAFERLWHGSHTKRLGELFIVSSLGLAVNLVGMMAFGHHHHGHDHGDAHACGHSHAQDQSKSHEKHDHSDHSHAGHDHGGHSHDNENMRGIYLHILADTLGSASVIVSTALTGLSGWDGWDPLASCFIAGLIFLSAQPLVLSAARRLLLSVPEDTEYNLRNLLGGILQQRGVVDYKAPKFWRDDRSTSGAGNKLVGVVNVVAGRGAPLDDVRERVQEYLLSEGIDVAVQVEREGGTSVGLQEDIARQRRPRSPVKGGF